MKFNIKHFFYKSIIAMIYIPLMYDANAMNNEQYIPNNVSNTNDKGKICDILKSINKEIYDCEMKISKFMYERDIKTFTQDDLLRDICKIINNALNININIGNNDHDLLLNIQNKIYNFLINNYDNYLNKYSMLNNIYSEISNFLSTKNNHNDNNSKTSDITETLQYICKKINDFCSTEHDYDNNNKNLLQNIYEEVNKCVITDSDSITSLLQKFQNDNDTILNSSNKYSDREIKKNIAKYYNKLEEATQKLIELIDKYKLDIEQFGITGIRRISIQLSIFLDTIKDYIPNYNSDKENNSNNKNMHYNRRYSISNLMNNKLFNNNENFNNENSKRNKRPYFKRAVSEQYDNTKYNNSQQKFTSNTSSNSIYKKREIPQKGILTSDQEKKILQNAIFKRDQEEKKTYRRKKNNTNNNYIIFTRNNQVSNVDSTIFGRKTNFGDSGNNNTQVNKNTTSKPNKTKILEQKIDFKACKERNDPINNNNNNFNTNSNLTENNITDIDHFNNYVKRNKLSNSYNYIGLGQQYNDNTIRSSNNIKEPYIRKRSVNKRKNNLDLNRSTILNSSINSNNEEYNLGASNRLKNSVKKRNNNKFYPDKNNILNTTIKFTDNNKYNFESFNKRKDRLNISYNEDLVNRSSIIDKYVYNRKPSVDKRSLSLKKRTIKFNKNYTNKSRNPIIQLQSYAPNSNSFDNSPQISNNLSLINKNADISKCQDQHCDLDKQQDLSKISRNISNYSTKDTISESDNGNKNTHEIPKIFNKRSRMNDRNNITDSTTHYKNKSFVDGNGIENKKIKLSDGLITTLSLYKQQNK